MSSRGSQASPASLRRYYWRMLPFLEGRTQSYFNFSGIFFTETKMIFGAYTGEDYGCTRPEGYPVWLEDSDAIHLDFAVRVGAWEGLRASGWER